MDDIPTTFDGEMAKFKNWISTRLTWLDANWPAYQTIDVDQNAATANVFCRIFPNPTSDYIYLESNQPLAVVEFYNSTGSIVKSIDGKSAFSIKVDIQSLPKGIYMVRTTTVTGNVLTEKVLVEK